MQERMQRLALYEDSSSDEEGPGGTSLYWHLPPAQRCRYKPALRAMCRARNRRAYVSHLSAQGIAVKDVPPAGPKVRKRKGAASQAPASLRPAEAVANEAPDALAAETSRDEVTSADEVAKDAQNAANTEAEEAGEEGDLAQRTVALPLVDAQPEVAALLASLVEAGVFYNKEPRLCAQA
jgi:hypothetical protein